VKINKKYALWMILNITIFLILSYILNRSMFSSEIDKFYGQMQNVYNNRSLGVLNLFYSIRYYAIYPFFQIKLLELPKIFEHITLIAYLSPILFFLKIPRSIQYFSILLLYMSLFFSYRTIIVMASLYMLTIHIRYIDIKKANLFITFFYSFLSSGTFLLWLIIIVSYKKKLIKNKKYNKLINLLIMLIVLLLVGPITHKLLFFMNPNKFGGSVNATFLEALAQINIGVLFTNIFERSLIYEAYIKGNYIRLFITGFELFISFLLVFFTKKVYLLLLFILLLISLLFEGLMIYSLLFSVLVLMYDYMYRQFKRKGSYYAKDIIS